MFYIAVRQDRFKPYTMLSTTPEYGRAKIEQLTLKANYYDAQVFSSPECRREDLVFTNPRIQGRIHPYTRIERLITTYQTENTFRVLVARPSPSLSIDHFRMFMFSFERAFGLVEWKTHLFELHQEQDVVRQILVHYDGGLPGKDPNIFVSDLVVETTPVRGSRLDGVYFADVIEDHHLYFGYANASVDDSKVVFDEINRTFNVNLYDLR